MSSVHRHTQAIKRRDQHPESSQWEIEAGSAWLRLMVFAALYFFGLKSGVGANTLSLFFKMIRIDTHVGVSVFALRTQLNQMETLLPIFQELCEKQIKKQPHKIIASLDETFFGEFITYIPHPLIKILINKC